MARELRFTDEGWNDYLFCSEDKALRKKVNSLIKDALRNPTEGLGDPHPLVGDLKGFRGRAITKKDRLVYAFDRSSLTVISARFHYDDH